MKTFKDLSNKEESELILWLSYLKESLDNAKRQMTRWKRRKNNWDLEMFINSVAYIYDASLKLNRYFNFKNGYIIEKQYCNILKQFRKEVDKNHIISLRNDLVHREKIFQLQDRNGKTLPNVSILILGGYNYTNDIYEFGPDYKMRVSDIFSIVRNLRHDIKNLYASKLKMFYTSGEYESMIPFTRLRDFETRVNKINKIGFEKQILRRK